ncbi:3-deoxy-manno-octulosonate cytidylyltransferase [Aminithiophilus ramosus]|uniref:3-deoxy-manno-octulosonate cytidylyltransferase n=2 Tax=Synergistales TaxID=649776 RepID=A0A9Q7ABQ7_9BACT|nr:3-deoxy-manno-octulosonate cytidylyltransferase [Aminithiophilus ramosus]QTX31619.1 3-deoxy-manno-octulosonate cytidylyltransferase [Aminithiophilus ramosus]QVL35426.1 3-deoxy-manno-octulosonate cytidylyltransferase [Synergistota bacterium]
MTTLAVIPARFGSTRLPGKALLEIGGMPLVVRVLRQVQRCRSVDRVLVAVDDERIASVVDAWGGEALMTPRDLKSGGDRVAHVARSFPEAEIVLNVQVDDPLVGPDMVDPLVAALTERPDVRLALLVKEIERAEEIDNPNIVKAVFSPAGEALYFSRSPIPYSRNEGGRWYKHIGPYAYRRDLLLAFSDLPQTPLEKTESLEMLRLLEGGETILVVPVGRDTIEIDTADDVAALERYLTEKGDDLR